MVCDFCSFEGVIWEYPAKDVRVVKSQGQLVFESIGSWGACEDCADLIEAGDYEGLHARSVWAFRMIYGEVPEIAKQACEYIKVSHQAFIQARYGKRREAIKIVGGGE